MKRQTRKKTTVGRVMKKTKINWTTIIFGGRKTERILMRERRQGGSFLWRMKTLRSNKKVYLSIKEKSKVLIRVQTSNHQKSKKSNLVLKCRLVQTKMMTSRTRTTWILMEMKKMAKTMKKQGALPKLHHS